MTATLRTRPQPRCPLCAADGLPLYSGLRDRLFGAPGSWSHRRCPAAGCGLLWLDPMPLVEDLHLAYANYYTHAAQRDRSGALARLFAAAKRGYLANRFGYREGVPPGERALGWLPWLYPGRVSELDFSVMWLEARGRGRLLDVGAGSGWLVGQMRALGWQAEGIDLDPRAVESAQARGLPIRQGSLPEAGYPSDAIDAVTMSHCIEHVHDPVALLAEARRILKAGGRLAVATPNTRSWLHRRFRESWFPLDPPRHLVLFDRRSLGLALERAGFSSVRLFTSVRDANGAWLGSRAIHRSARHDMLAAASAGAALLGRMLQLAETAKMIADDDAGEDLVALAEK